MLIQWPPPLPLDNKQTAVHWNTVALHCLHWRTVSTKDTYVSPCLMRNVLRLDGWMQTKGVDFMLNEEELENLIYLSLAPYEETSQLRLWPLMPNEVGLHLSNNLRSTTSTHQHTISLSLSIPLSLSLPRSVSLFQTLPIKPEGSCLLN